MKKGIGLKTEKYGKGLRVAKIILKILGTIFIFAGTASMVGGGIKGNIEQNEFVGNYKDRKFQEIELALENDEISSEEATVVLDFLSKSDSQEIADYAIKNDSKNPTYKKLIDAYTRSRNVDNNAVVAGVSGLGAGTVMLGAYVCTGFKKTEYEKHGSGFVSAEKGKE